MIAVIFEFEPDAGKTAEYLEIASRLHPMVEEIDGFISIERFESLTHPGKILSLSFWRDEEAVKEWRNVAEHRQAQCDGRNGIFSGYRLRVASVIREYGLDERDQVPDDSRAAHD
ncbi:MAG: antibiotic biosynthesis monooxygenase [Gammaproteobacteria bacterium]|jgi:heme-degrading monooxygenase HmoA